jgi:hypothetical protein
MCSSRRRGTGNTPTRATVVEEVRGRQEVLDLHRARRTIPSRRRHHLMPRRKLSRKHNTSLHHSHRRDIRQRDQTLPLRRPRCQKPETGTTRRQGGRAIGSRRGGRDQRQLGLGEGRVMVIMECMEMESPHEGKTGRKGTRRGDGGGGRGEIEGRGETERGVRRDGVISHRAIGSRMLCGRMR